MSQPKIAIDHTALLDAQIREMELTSPFSY